MHSTTGASAAITVGAGAMNSTTGAGAAIKHSGFYRPVLAPNVLIGAGTKETAGAGRPATPPLTLALRTRLVLAPRTRQALRDVPLHLHLHPRQELSSQKKRDALRNWR